MVQGSYDAVGQGARLSLLCCFTLDGPHPRVTTVSAVFQQQDGEDLTRAHLHCFLVRFLEAAT